MKQQRKFSVVVACQISVLTYHGSCLIAEPQQTFPEHQDPESTHSSFFHPTAVALIQLPPYLELMSDVSFTV